MLNKKIMILTIIFVSLLAVSAVSAADNATDDIVSVDETNEEIDSISASDINDTAIASEDTNDNIDKISLPAQEVIQGTTDDGLSDEVLAVEEHDDAVSIDENNAKSIISEEITNDEPVLTSQITNKEILSDNDHLNTLKLTFVKQTGKYTNNKKVYFKVTWVDAGIGADDVQIKYVVYKSNGAKEKVGYATTNENGIGCIKFADGKTHIGTFKIKAELYHWQGWFYGDTVYTDPATIKNVKIYKSRYKVSAPSIKKKYKKSALFKVTVKDKATGKRLKGVKVIMKVYTGKKYKKIVHRTNKKGKTGFNTKRLSKGKHKVVIILKANSKYKKAVKRSYITIKGKTTKAKSTNSKSNKKSKPSKSKTRKGKTKKGKIRTTIEAQGSMKKHMSTTYQQMGLYKVPVTNYYPDIIFTATLKAANGKVIKGKYKATIKYYSDGKQDGTASFEGEFGKTRIYYGKNHCGPYQLVITYKGNSKYRASTFTTDRGCFVYF